MEGSRRWLFDRRIVGTLGLALVLTSVPASAQKPGSSTRSQVRDNGRLFGTEAVRTAEATLGQVESQSRQATFIETVDSFRGESPASAIDAVMKRTDRVGLFVLLSGRDKHIEVKASPSLATVWPRSRLDAVRDAFLARFKVGKLDDGLRDGVKAIESYTTANVRQLAATETPRSERPAGESSLVVRNQVHLTLAGARLIVAGAEAKAAALGLKVNVAVVDDGGHPISFARMDGARPASGYTALTKATTAATFRRATGPLANGPAEADPLLNLSLQNAAAASGGKITTLYGGVPIEVDGQVIGGVGVGGGTGEQDADVARAGIQAFVERISKEALTPGAPASGSEPRGR